MNLFLILALSLFGALDWCEASDWEWTAAGQYTHYKVSDVQESGLSARLRYFPKSSDSSWFFGGNFSGGSLFIGDFLAGYSLRSSGDYFYELGGALRYSAIFGTGVTAVLGAGVKGASGWYVHLPILIKFGLWIEITPYIGIRF